MTIYKRLPFQLYSDVQNFDFIDSFLVNIDNWIQHTSYLNPILDSIATQNPTIQLQSKEGSSSKHKINMDELKKYIDSLKSKENKHRHTLKDLENAPYSSLLESVKKTFSSSHKTLFSRSDRFFIPFNIGKLSKPVCKDFLLLFLCSRLIKIDTHLRNSLKEYYDQLKSQPNLGLNPTAPIMARIKSVTKTLSLLYIFADIYCSHKESTWLATFQDLEQEEKLDMISTAAKLHETFPQSKKWLFNPDKFSTFKNIIKNKSSLIHCFTTEYAALINARSQRSRLYDKKVDNATLESQQAEPNFNLPLANAPYEKELCLTDWKNTFYIVNQHFDSTFDTSYQQILTELVFFSDSFTSFFTKINADINDALDCDEKLKLYMKVHFSHLESKPLYTLEDLNEFITHFELDIQLPQFDDDNYQSSIASSPPSEFIFLKYDKYIYISKRIDSSELELSNKESLSLQKVFLYEAQDEQGEYKPKILYKVLNTFFNDIQTIERNKLLLVMQYDTFKNMPVIQHEHICVNNFLFVCLALAKEHNFNDLVEKFSNRITSTKRLDFRSDSFLITYFKDSLTTSADLHYGSITQGRTIFERVIFSLETNQSFATLDWVLDLLNKQSLFEYITFNLEKGLSSERDPDLQDTEAFKLMHKNQCKQFDLLLQLFTAHYFTDEDTSFEANTKKYTLLQALGLNNGKKNTPDFNRCLKWINDIDLVLVFYDMRNSFLDQSFYMQNRSKIKFLRDIIKQEINHTINLSYKEKNSFNAAIKDLQKLINTIEVSKNKFKTTRLISKFDSFFNNEIKNFSRTHQIDLYKVISLLLAAYCLPHMNEGNKCFNNITQLATLCSEELGEFSPYVNTFLNTINLEDDIKKPELRSYFIYQDFFNTVIKDLLQTTYSINLDFLSINCDIPFILDALAIKVDLPTINNKIYTSLDINKIDFEKISFYPLEVILQIFSDPENFRITNSKDFWILFVSYKQAFNKIINSFFVGEKSFEKINSINEYPYYNEFKSLGSKLHRRSIPFLLHSFLKTNAWFVSQVQDHLDITIKNSDFETFLDTMYLKSFLDIRLFFLPAFIKALNSSKFQEINALERKNLVLKKLDLINKYIRIDDSDKIFNMCKCKENSQILFLHLRYLEILIEGLLNEQLVDNVPINIECNKHDLKEKDIKEKLTQISYGIHYIYNSIGSVIHGKIEYSQSSIVSNVFSDIIHKREKLLSDNEEVYPKSDALQQELSSLDNELQTTITKFKAEITAPENNNMYIIQNMRLQTLSEPYSWEKLAQYLYEIYLFEPKFIKGKLIIFNELFDLINKCDIQEKNFLALKKFIVDKKKIYPLLLKKKRTYFLALKHFIGSEKKIQSFQVHRNHTIKKHTFGLLSQFISQQIDYNEQLNTLLNRAKHQKLTRLFNLLKQTIKHTFIEDAIRKAIQSNSMTYFKQFYHSNISLASLDPALIKDLASVIPIPQSISRLSDLAAIAIHIDTLETRINEAVDTLNLNPLSKKSNNDISHIIKSFNALNLDTSSVILDDIQINYLNKDSKDKLNQLIGPLDNTTTFSDIAAKAHSILETIKLLNDIILKGDFSSLTSLNSDIHIVNFLPDTTQSMLFDYCPSLTTESGLFDVRSALQVLGKKCEHVTTIVSEFKLTQRHCLLFSLQGDEKLVRLLKPDVQDVLTHTISDFLITDSLSSLNIKLARKVIDYACKHKNIFLLSELSGDVKLELSQATQRDLYNLLSQSEIGSSIKLSHIADLAKKELRFRMNSTINRYFNSVSRLTNQALFLNYLYNFLPNFGTISKNDYVKHYQSQINLHADLNNQCLFSLLNIFDTFTQLIIDGHAIKYPTSITTNLDNAKKTIAFIDTLTSNYDRYKHNIPFITGVDTMNMLNVIKNSLGVFYHLLAQKNASASEENPIEINILNRILYLYCDFINTYFLKK